MLDFLVTGASMLTGGLTGLVGIGIGRLFDWLKERQEVAKLKLQFEQEREMRKIDVQLVDKEWAGRTQIAQVEMAGAQAVAENKAFEASYRLEPERYATGAAPKGTWGRVGWFLLVLVDGLRGSIRPGLTIYLCVLTTMIYLMATRQLGEGLLDPEDALQLTKDIINTVLYLTVTCVTWWFGRNPGASAAVAAPVAAKKP